MIAGLALKPPARRPVYEPLCVLAGRGATQGHLQEKARRYDSVEREVNAKSTLSQPEVNALLTLSQPEVNAKLMQHRGDFEVSFKYLN